MKKLFSAVSVVLLLTVLLLNFASCSLTEETEPAKESDVADTSNKPLPQVNQTVLCPEAFRVSESATNYVLINVVGYGQIIVELYPDVAPITVANFQKLVGEGFYNGLIFHRVINNFMIQGGDPEGTGFGGSEETIKGEFASNGVENNLLHTRGVISMARSYDPDSASSQFFICHRDSHHLDGDYAAFGKVIYGMETVDAIASVRTNASDKPISNVVMQSMQFVTPNET